MKRLSICLAGMVFAVTAFGQQLGTVSPANASVRPGDTVPLTFTASGMGAYGELDVAIGNYNVVSNPTSGCYFYYYQGAVYLLDDSNSSYNSVALGTQQSASGGNCSVNGAGSTASVDGNGNLTLVLSMSFSTWMAGTNAYYEQAQDDQYGSSSGWWQIPDAFLAIGMLGPPQLGTVAPASGASPPNQGNTFTFTATDPNGAWGISEVDIMIGPPGATGWDGTSLLPVVQPLFRDCVSGEPEPLLVAFCGYKWFVQHQLVVHAGERQHGDHNARHAVLEFDGGNQQSIGGCLGMERGRLQRFHGLGRAGDFHGVQFADHYDEFVSFAGDSG
jgi:hypothetical protein